MISRLLEISKKLEQNDLTKRLEEIASILNVQNAPLVLPLVGEFSSGKTTLVNALTDSKMLETATKPTTATIYQIFFGNEKCSATVINEDGSSVEITDFSELKNDKLSNAAVVEVFDTSNKISPTTVLVDTPGLSSPDKKHKEVLVDFIPKADGVLLVTDINQQVTKSLVDFTKEIALSNRPVYLIITKCDTKPKSEIEAAKKYILENSELAIKGIACVSAETGDLNELYEILQEIDKDKSSILKSVNEQRLKNIAKILSERIDELLNATKNDSELDEAIKNQKRDLEKLQRNIDKLIDDVSYSISDIERKVCDDFSDSVFSRLDSLVASNSSNLDVEAVSVINGLTSQHLNFYKSKIQDSIYEIVNEKKNSEFELNLQSLKELDFSSIKMSQLSYNLNLNEIGHQYDGIISGAAKVVAAAGAAVAIVATAGAAAPAVAGGAVAAGGTATTIGTVIAGSADAALVAGVNYMNNKSRERELAMLRQQHLLQFKDEFNKEMKNVEDYNQQFGEKIGSKKGFVEGIVSKITDKIGKPQRQRMIHSYIAESLIPEFSLQMKNVSQNLLSVVKVSLNNEATELVNQKTEVLNNLKTQKENSVADFNARIEFLKNCKKELAS